MALNDIYFEDLNDATVDGFFTTVDCTLVATDAVTALWLALVDVVLLTSTTDRTIVAPIFNQMLLFTSFGNPAQRYPIRTPASLTTILNATLAATRLLLSSNLV